MEQLTPDRPKRKIFKRRRIQFAYSVLRWHGRLGVAAAFLFLILLATGIALNHTDRLALDQRYITTEWLLNWYGVAPTNASVSYKVNSHWVTELDGHLFWDGALIYEHAGSVKGAIQVRERFIVTTIDALYLFDQDGNLIEKIVDLPAKVSRLGWRDQHIYIDTHMGVFFTNSTFLVWQQADRIPNWVQVTGAPDGIEDDVLCYHNNRLNSLTTFAVGRETDRDGTRGACVNDKTRAVGALEGKGGFSDRDHLFA